MADDRDLFAPPTDDEIFTAPTSDELEVSSPVSEAEAEDDSTVLDKIADMSGQATATGGGALLGVAANKAIGMYAKGAEDRASEKAFDILPDTKTKQDIIKETVEKRKYKTEPYITKKDLGKLAEEKGLTGFIKPSEKLHEKIAPELLDVKNKADDLLNQYNPQAGTVKISDVQQKMEDEVRTLLNPDRSDKGFKEFEKYKKQKSKFLSQKGAGDLSLTQLNELKQDKIDSTKFPRAKDIEKIERKVLKDYEEQLVASLGSEKLKEFQDLKKQQGTSAKLNKLLDEYYGLSKNTEGFTENVAKKPYTTGVVAAGIDTVKRPFKVASKQSDKLLSIVYDQFQKLKPGMKTGMKYILPGAGGMVTYGTAKAEGMSDLGAGTLAAVDEATDFIPGIAQAKMAAMPTTSGPREFDESDDVFKNSVFADEVFTPENRTPEYKLEQGQQLTKEDMEQLDPFPNIDENSINEVKKFLPGPQQSEPAIIPKATKPEPKTLNLAKATDMSSDEITNRTQQMVAKYGDKATSFANVLTKAATSPDRTRTALMFSLYQQPAFRKMFLEDDEQG